MKKNVSSLAIFLFLSSMSWGHSMSPDKLKLISTPDEPTVATFSIKNRYNEDSIFEMEAFLRTPGILGNDRAPQTDLIKFSPRNLELEKLGNGTVKVLYVRNKSNDNVKNDEFWICSVRLPVSKDKGPVFKTGMRTRICSKMDVNKR